MKRTVTYELDIGANRHRVYYRVTVDDDRRLLVEDDTRADGRWHAADGRS